MTDADADIAADVDIAADDGVGAGTAGLDDFRFFR